MDLLERLDEDWGLLKMFRDETGTDSLNRPLNDLQDAQEEITRLRETIRLGHIFMAEQTDENAARFEAALKIK